MSNTIEIIGDVTGYRSVWSLCTVSKTKGTNGKPLLKEVYYAVVIVHGRNPVWAVFNVNGKFVRYASSLDMIARFYPKLALRRRMAKWVMASAENFTIDKRIADFSQAVRHSVPTSIRNPNEGEGE